MYAVHQCVMRSLLERAVTTAGTLSAALLRSVASRLPIKDPRCITAALSPRWRRVWRSASLDLDDTHLITAGMDKVVTAVDHVLAAHPGPFRTVRLTNCFFGALDDESELGAWPRLLAAGGVQNLVLVSPPPPIDMPLPADILRCTKLRRLYLGFWGFPDTRNLPDGAGVFPHLREFAILNTRIEGRNLDHMLASSPVLETLVLVASYAFPQHVHLRGQNLRCVLFWLSMAGELAALGTPRLERLLIWLTTTSPCVDDSDDEPPMRVRIASAPELKVLGYLDARVHQLLIGNTVIKADTGMRPSGVVPSVKILALKVDFGVFTEIQMLFSFLRCFPNVETLHLEFAMADQPTDKHYGDFLSKLSAMECLQSHIRKVVLHEFRGDLSNVVSVQYLTQRASQRSWSKTASAWPMLRSPASPSRLPPKIHSYPLALRRFSSTPTSDHSDMGVKAAGEVHEGVTTLLHEQSRVLQNNINHLREQCIEGTSFHLSFDPEEYLKYNPIIDSVHVPDTTPKQFIYKALDDGVIVLSEGRIRIRPDHIKFIPLTNADGGSEMNDFRNCAEVLEELVKLHQKPEIMNLLQADLSDWFKSLRTFTGTNTSDVYYILHHSSLLPLNSRPAVYLKTYQFAWNNLSGSVSNQVLLSVPLRYGANEHWYDIAINSTGLKPWMSYKPYQNDKLGLLRLHRNCYSHPEMSQVDVNLLLHALFPNVLNIMHEQLSQVNKLHLLRLEENFREKKAF